MGKPIVIGNWKMNKTAAEGISLAKALDLEIRSKNLESIAEIIIAPPFITIRSIAEILRQSSSSIKLGAQNLHWEDFGAFTGEISPMMLKEAGAEYAILGHSERRQLFHETNDKINQKIKAALKHQLIPIFCLGETLAERETGKINEILTNQLNEGLNSLTSNEISKIIIAYEPVWAIGTGKTASPDQAEEVHLFLRELITDKYGQSKAKEIKLLYGGSVNGNNSRELLQKPNIDGALVGGASLKSDDFVAIITSLI